MRRAPKWLLIAGAAVVLAALAVVGIGSLLPAEHEASRTIFLPRSAREIWNTVTRWRELPRWRSDVRRVHALEGRRGWVEVGRSEELSLAIVRAVPPKDLVIEIVGDQPFTGSWTYAIRPVESGAGCNVTITERGRVANPVARFVFNVFMDERATMTAYLNDLAARFREDPEFVD